MSRRYLPVFLAAGILFVAAVVGYLIPASSDGPPPRILLENAGGKIILTHAAHIESQGGDCAKCHHTTGDNPAPPKCTTCHVKKFDETFITDHKNTIDKALCVSCHHPTASIDKFSHDDHAGDYTGKDCQSCHHGKGIEPEPTACSNCHESQDNGDKPNLKTANHTRCADCHDDFYKEGLKGCTHCHTRKEAAPETTRQQACSNCHTHPAEELVPTTTAAFHGKCMGCHEEQGAGPFGDGACYQCHMK